VHPVKCHVAAARSALPGRRGLRARFHRPGARLDRRPLLLALLLATGSRSTEAFAWTFAVITVTMAAGSAFGGVIIQGAGTETAFLSAGGLGLAGAAFGALRLAAHGPEQAAQRS
jgi:hypothetical protein